MSGIIDFIGGAPVVIALVKAVIAFGILLNTLIFLIWAERRILGDMQARIGPNRWGPAGLLQTVADGIKLILKEDFRPRAADRWTYALAPVVATVTSILAFAVVPIGDHITIGDRRVDLVMADLNIGVLYFLAMGSIGVYGIVLAGWSSGSKYPLLGGIRSSAQMISYEIALGLSLVPVVLATGSLSMLDIVAAQSENVRNVTFFNGVPVLEQIARLFEYVPNWYIWSQWPAFFIFLVAGLAETNRAPFDLPEAETELVAGYHTEYSALKFALFFMAEYVNMFTVSMLATTLFLGGWQGPFVDVFPWIGIVWFLLKVTFFLFLYIWLRGTLPRFRFDQLMNFGWKFLLPVALLNLIVTATVVFFWQT